MSHTVQSFTDTKYNKISQLHNTISDLAFGSSSKQYFFKFFTEEPGCHAGSPEIIVSIYNILSFADLIKISHHSCKSHEFGTKLFWQLHQNE